MSSKEEKKYKIIFSNNKEYLLEEKFLDHIPKLKDALCNKDDKEYDIIYNSIESHIFQYLLTFINYTIEHPNDKIFIKNFLKNMDINTLFDVIYASKFFGVEKLLKYASNHFKSVIDENNPEQIKKLYGL